MTYQEQINYLTKNPLSIMSHWCAGEGLFKWVGNMLQGAGCLTMIRSDSPGYSSFKVFIKGKEDDKLRAEIKADERIPKRAADITVECLPVFKEWQEKIDKLQNA